MEKVSKTQKLLKNMNLMSGDREAEYVYMDPDVALDYLNISLELVGESQLKRRNLGLSLMQKIKLIKLK